MSTSADKRFRTTAAWLAALSAVALCLGCAGAPGSTGVPTGTTIVTATGVGTVTTTVSTPTGTAMATATVVKTATAVGTATVLTTAVTTATVATATKLSTGTVTISTPTGTVATTGTVMTTATVLGTRTTAVTSTGGGSQTSTGAATATGITGTTATTGTGSNTGTGGGARPPGYWMASDWGLSTNWAGCAWTGKDKVAGSSTTLAPADFTTSHTPADPYHISGSVFNNWDAVALLGFNLAEPIGGSSTQCKYNPEAASAKGPPGVPFPAGTSGLAINFAKSGAFTLRVQIQGADGAIDANNRWCTTILAPTSPVFVKFSEFNTVCWTSTTPGKPYAGEPISAVVLMTPGASNSGTGGTAFDFTMNGFAAGNSAADAPKGGTVSGPLTGTIGGANTEVANYQKVKVGAGGKSYIIQNNNWGSSGSGQTISYKDNSFKITAMTGNGGSAPASFPSIYIGANGDTQKGLYSTTSDDNLPMQISAIKSVQTTFSWTGGSGGRDFNAAYDVWFSANKPGGSYNDAISGFVMVWFYDPPNHQPIGGVKRPATIGGKSFDVWVGRRGGNGVNANVPVVSYVAKSTIASWTFDLNLFIKDAVANAGADKDVGGFSGAAFSSSWYLTDVFGGFEIWTGSDSANLECTAFTAVVQ